MKNKIFNNKKSHNFIKLISILILLSITLYFSFSDLISYKENFNSEYKNLCKNKPTKFYSNVSPILTTDYGNFDESDSCEYKCNKTDGCNLYIYNNNTNNNNNNPTDSCDLYNLVSGTNIHVNCDNNMFDSTIQKATYLGEGLIKTNYYNNNTSDFSYHNFLLDQTLELKSKFDDFKEMPNSFSTTQKNVNSIYNNFINNNITPILTKISNHLDLCNNLVTSMNVQDTQFNLQGQNISAESLYSKFLNLNNKSNFNEASTRNNNIEFTRIGLIYTILAIILIISIIMILIYKLFPNYLNEFTLFIYFISTLFIVFFIHILL
jgi:hypothetical protein